MPVDPPRAKSPPLTALRAFEAAARLGGFSRAADELSVSPGAISQHIKSLEEWAGVRLFRREAQGVVLTDEGAAILADVTNAFDVLGSVAQQLRAAGRVVQIAALPAIAQLWLAPRLPLLRSLCPELTLSVTALEQPPNLLRDPYALSIFYAPTQAGTLLSPDEIFPVCTPEIAKKLNHPADLSTVPCIVDTSWVDDWPRWLAIASPTQSIPLQGPGFSLYALALAEAENGAGVLMGHAALVAGALARGSLVRPFNAALTLDCSLTAMLPPAPGNQAARRLLKALKKTL